MSLGRLEYAAPRFRAKAAEAVRAIDPGSLKFEKYAKRWFDEPNPGISDKAIANRWASAVKRKYGSMSTLDLIKTSRCFCSCS